jgi:ribosome recycling factor
MTTNELKTACDKVIAHLETAYMHLQLGRASSGLVEELHVHVESRGMDQKMNQVANITTIDSQTLKIEPWDKAVLKDIEKSIYDANIGLTPQNQ